MFSVRDFLSVVAQLLQKDGVNFVEYGEMLEQRLGCPVALQTVEWAILDEFLDEQIPRASEIILQHDLPLGEPSSICAKMYGEWGTSGVIHKIRKTQVYTRAMRIHLLPLPLVYLTLDDTIETTATFNCEQKTLSPIPQIYFIGLMRNLISYPVGHTNRRRIARDLLSFITFYIFHERYRGIEEEDTETEEEFQKRVEKQ
ncbi:hypothetical protein VTN00DRAFT_4882 [Thermoascus crustaceus]|uniref:uncharacterized protein n=1 Tax=Thermoascus crustaceus TaxID=5088 RepID=UPI00374427FF